MRLVKKSVQDLVIRIYKNQPENSSKETFDNAIKNGLIVYSLGAGWGSDSGWQLTNKGKDLAVYLLNKK